MPDKITMLNLELNSSCNLRCKWCSLDHFKPRRVMARETLETVMEQLAHGALPALARIELHNGGETLLHPDLPSMLGVVRRHRERIAPVPLVRLLTNGMLLTEKVSRQLLRSCVLDRLRVSIDGGGPRRYETVRKGASWDRLVENVVGFMRLNKQDRRPVKTEAICLLDRAEKSAPHPQFQELLALFDAVSLRHPHNWDGSADLGVDDSDYRATAGQCRGRVCWLLERGIVVLPGGEVTVCCNDLNARGVIGNVLETDLGELAAGPARQGMKRLMAEGRMRDIQLCRDCTGFYARPCVP